MRLFSPDMDQNAKSKPRFTSPALRTALYDRKIQRGFSRKFAPNRGKFWDLKRWHVGNKGMMEIRRLGTLPHVSVNLSPDDLADPDLPKRVEWMLDNFKVSAKTLCLEIVENVIAQD